MSLLNPLTWLDKFFMKAVQWLGAAMPDEPILNFGTGFTVTDDPANGRTTVTVSVPGAFEGLVALAAPISSSALVTGTRYLVDTSGGAFTQPLPTTGLTDGQWYEFFDSTSPGTWSSSGTKNLTLNGGSNTILDPNTIGFGGTYSTSVVLQTKSATFRVTWSQLKGAWITR